MEAKADFSGYATKAGLLCTDGRTIMPHAFKHQDNTQVPLVWQHGHNKPENVLGHVLLENRDDGVYAYAFFNQTPAAQHAKNLVAHGDIKNLSIWANELMERGKRVMHGKIREVSLVLAGANPGATIDNITIAHGDGDSETLEDEAIIHTGLEFELDNDDNKASEEEINEVTTDVLTHAAGDETIQDVYDSLTDKQKQVVHFLIGEAVASAQDSMAQSAVDFEFEDGEAQAIFEEMTPEQQAVVVHMLDDAIDYTTTQIQHSIQEGNEMHRNVFEDDKKAAASAPVLSHDDMKTIVADAGRTGGSFKDALHNYAIAHGIENIDLMFPDAVAISNQPEFLKRRTEWVTKLLASVRKSPFSRIKTFNADLTFDQARAKGYVKGSLKKEEFFPVARRITTPTTIYKKQKLDRDDMIDIRDLDVVAWLKAEMRLMLDEEVARAILLGDGRDIAHEDKINEGNIRPIATDHELYTTVVNVNLNDASSSIAEATDAIVLNRGKFRGTGMPIMFTSETYIAKWMLLKDGLNRRMYRSLEELASELRVSEIVPVEVMEEYPDIVAVLVNPADYTVGTDRGGEVTMFDDFDIDYNQNKYLIETRMSGALTKLKSAMVVKSVTGTDVLATPAAPTFDGDSVTITNTTGVVYKNGAGVVINAAGSPYSVAPGETYVVNATPASGYYFATSDDDTWTFVGE